MDQHQGAWLMWGKADAMHRTWKGVGRPPKNMPSLLYPSSSPPLPIIILFMITVVLLASSAISTQAQHIYLGSLPL